MFTKNKHLKILRYEDGKISIKLINLISNISKGTIGFFILIIGILIFLFGIKYQDTCLVTTIIGAIMFFIGLKMLFIQPKKY